MEDSLDILQIIGNSHTTFMGTNIEKDTIKLQKIEDIIAKSSFNPNFKFPDSKQKFRLEEMISDTCWSHYDPPFDYKNIANNTIYERGTTLLMEILKSRAIINDEYRIKISNMIISHPDFDPNIQNENGKTAIIHCFDCGEKHDHKYYLSEINRIIKAEQEGKYNVAFCWDHFYSYDYIRYNGTKKKIASMIMQHPKFNKNIVDKFGRNLEEACKQKPNNVSRWILKQL